MTGQQCAVYDQADAIRADMTGEPHTGPDEGAP